jgi:hypothetical protein
MIKVKIVKELILNGNTGKNKKSYRVYKCVCDAIIFYDNIHLYASREYNTEDNTEYRRFRRLDRRYVTDRKVKVVSLI